MAVGGRDGIEVKWSKRREAERFQSGDEVDLKALLASAPLEGIDLTRDRGFDRDVDL